ncbi:hypothetical protein [Caballeronia sp. BR00000012568055]|uniref:hypothetical protein n=1 Tax=Caballeronia sp. BR00000012568055 TaxID=2918761 RepID=UPI0023F9DDF6|nr:hypothetical protein [Caballeronia sp. BR00000012568055]
MHKSTLIDDALEHYPDGSDKLLIDAIRAWFRPHCDAVRGHATWQDVLCDCGSTRDGMHCFDMLMREWVSTAQRPLDVRCRCCTEFAADEVHLLHAVACFQSNDWLAARALLRQCFSPSCIDRLSDITHWFALMLGDTGVAVRNRERRVTYLH